MTQPSICQDLEMFRSLFWQTFSMKSIVSWPLECNLSLILVFFPLLCGLRTLLNEMEPSPVTLPDIHIPVFSLSQEMVLFFSHLASLHHWFKRDWLTSTKAQACHTFSDLLPEDEKLERKKEKWSVAAFTFIWQSFILSLSSPQAYTIHSFHLGVCCGLLISA